MRYVDDTLLLAQEEKIMFIFDKFNSFQRNLRFTIDRFDDNNIHFIDIAIDKNKTNLYCKTTHTGPYYDINSNVPWNYKFHGLNLFTTEQTKFVHQVKSLGLKLTR